MLGSRNRSNHGLKKLGLVLLGAGVLLKTAVGADSAAGTRVRALLKAKRIALPQAAAQGLDAPTTNSRLRPPYWPGLLMPILWDDFQRSNTEEPGAGEPLIGSRWLLIGDGGTWPSKWGMIKNGYLTASQYGCGKTVYACQRLSCEPVRLDAVFRWEKIAENGADGTFVLAVGPDEGSSWIRDLVHVRFHRNAVIYDTIIDGIMRSEVALKRFEGNQLPYGVDHHGVVILDWDKPLITVYLNGELMFECSDAPMKTLRGLRAFWEMYYGEELPKSKIMVGGAAAYARALYWSDAKSDADQRP